MVSVSRSSSSSRSGGLLGRTEPRIATAPLRELTPDTSLGFECIEFAEEVLGLSLYPWQEWLLIHALELLDDGTFRFRKVFVEVGRQNGKSTLLQVLSLWRMYLDRAPVVLGTAQDRNLARDQFIGALEIAQGVEDLAERIADFSLQRGFEKFKLRGGEEYRIAASNRRAGRGLSIDLALMDELREHQSWDAWSAVSKTTNARPRAQLWAVSNAGDAASIVLRHFRSVAHAGLGDPDGINLDPVTGQRVASVLPDEVEDDPDTSLGWFEWSAVPGCSIWDREQWAQANPSLGYGALTERVLASDAANDPEWVFRTEVLCQWFAGSNEGPFPPGAWLKGVDEVSAIAADSRLVACVDLSWDRSIAHISYAGFRPDGEPHVEVVASRAGTDWIGAWFRSPDRSRLPHALLWQRSGAPISSMTEELQKLCSDLGIEVVEWSGADLGRATGAFYDLVRQVVPQDDDPDAAPGKPGVWHRSQPVLDVAANTAVTKPSGDSWLWDRAKSPTDIAPLVAATGAVWGLLNKETVPTRSAYESSGLMLLD